jgi:hypothetical protein
MTKFLLPTACVRPIKCLYQVPTVASDDRQTGNATQTSPLLDTLPTVLPLHSKKRIFKGDRRNELLHDRLGDYLQQFTPKIDQVVHKHAVRYAAAVHDIDLLPTRRRRTRKLEKKATGSVRSDKQGKGSAEVFTSSLLRCSRESRASSTRGRSWRGLLCGMGIENRGYG